MEGKKRKVKIRREGETRKTSFVVSDLKAAGGATERLLYAKQGEIRERAIWILDDFLEIGARLTVDR